MRAASCTARSWPGGFWRSARPCWISSTARACSRSTCPPISSRRRRSTATSSLRNVPCSKLSADEKEITVHNDGRGEADGDFVGPGEGDGRDVTFEHAGGNHEGEDAEEQPH